MRIRRRAPRGSLIVISLVVIAAALTACSSSAPAADSPGGVVQAALGKLAAKDIDGLRSLACAGQEDLIRHRAGDVADEYASVLAAAGQLGERPSADRPQ